MLYGSCARGDAGPESDIDVLELVETPAGHYSAGRVSVSVYTRTQLQALVDAGSLFALHLAREGQVLEDPAGTLRKMLDSYRVPTTLQPLLSEIAAVAPALDVDEATAKAFPVGLVRLALYLVRTAAIARTIELDGHPVFAIETLADRLDERAMIPLFEGRESLGTDDLSRLPVARVLLARLLGVDSIRNPYGSLEALAVNLELGHPQLSALVLRVIAGEQTLGYGDLLLGRVVDRGG